MPSSFVFAAVLAASAPAADALPNPAPNPATIIAAENQFAADAQRFGVRVAFLAHFDAGSWLLRPYPVPALDALARDADDGSPLEWAPEIAGVAASGDMGFTSGAWSAQAPGVEKSAHGHFLTVWKRGADGIWRVQVDGGISHAALEHPAGAVKTITIATQQQPPLAADTLASRRHSLETADDALCAALAKAQGDTRPIWRDNADAEWRVLRPNELPADGDATWKLIAADPARRGSGPRRAYDVAASGDFGYSIGGDASCKECGTYYRLWRWRDDRWRVLIDVETP